MKFNFQVFPYKFEGCGETISPLLDTPCCNVCVCSNMCRWKEGTEKELREPKVSNKIMQWLVNNEDLPLKLKVEMIIGLYAKEILGE